MEIYGFTAGAGDKVQQTGIAGAAAQTEGETEGYVSHFHSSPRWWTGFAATNPSRSETANVTLNAFDNNGVSLGSANLIVPPRSKEVALVSSMFGIQNTNMIILEVGVNPAVDSHLESSTTTLVQELQMQITPGLGNWWPPSHSPEGDQPGFHR